MRKFRAWHTKLNRYLEPHEFYITPIGEVAAACFTTLDGEVITVNSIEDFSCDDFEEGLVILEEGTGIKDKNGKEIYEGDIVHNTAKVASNKSTTYQIYYDQTYAMYGMSPVDGKIDIGDFYGYIMRQSFEVIGNIHENPELCGEEEK